jgi:tRNA-dihydrouridine synthase
LRTPQKRFCIGFFLHLITHCKTDVAPASGAAFFKIQLLERNPFLLKSHRLFTPVPLFNSLDLLDRIDREEDLQIVVCFQPFMAGVRSLHDIDAARRDFCCLKEAPFRQIIGAVEHRFALFKRHKDFLFEPLVIDISARLLVPFFRPLPFCVAVKLSGDESVGAHLKCHGNCIRIEHRDVHRQEHFSNCRDLADEERQDQADRKEHAGKGYFFTFSILKFLPYVSFWNQCIIQVHFKVKTFSAFFLYFPHYFSMFCIFRASRCLTALSVGTFSVVFHGFVVHFWILGNAVIFCSSLTIFRKDFIIMQFYLAPMEGLTGYVYRNAYHKYFPAADRYFTPFITNKKMSSRERNDILPEHNEGMTVIPQILTNQAEDFLSLTKELREYGYDTVNLNLGCPSGTVVAKRRGSGLLAWPNTLDAFLDEIFSSCDCRISIKTRLGTTDTDEWEDLLTVYDKYPLEELIIHPRIQKDFYKYTPRMECYRTAYETSHCSLCYNGDIFSPDDFQNLCREFPDTEKVMLGRGVLQNPWLIGMLRSADPAGGEASAPDKELLHAFCEDLCAGYARVISGDKNVLFKLKALWIYLGMSFTNPQKYLKKIKKANRLAEYEEAVDALFREQELIL